jgi:hypothetical protein
VLDIDGKGWVKLCQYFSYVKTAKGIHIYLKIKSKKPPKNSMLFYQGKRMGDLLSKGRQAIGVDSKHVSGIIYQLVQRGK